MTLSSRDTSERLTRACLVCGETVTGLLRPEDGGVLGGIPDVDDPMDAVLLFRARDEWEMENLVNEPCGHKGFEVRP